ncbi:regulator of MON1-CCZ1 complex-like [Watersipora subatra]|uniref:regulator of MON1-CCZ1 complex-like n=1 Tax=Watersipora subatra TaxID=2589382 RepID=UPI00355C908D
MASAKQEVKTVSENYFAELSASPLRFDPAAPNVNVFFDDANQHVFVVRANGAGGIIMFEGATGKSNTFRTDDKGDIAAVRFSPSMQTLALQRAPNALDFINFIKDSQKESLPYCQTCKGKTTRITDFFWVSDSEIIFITDTGIELYELDSEKKSLKCTRTLSMGLVNWSLWHKSSRHLLISSGIYGNILHIFQYENGNLSKYAKLEVDLAFYPAEPTLTLLRRDVILSKVYGQLYVVVLKKDARASQFSQIILYKLTKERVAIKSNVLSFTSSGRFEVNIVDSMILVHQLQTKTTFLYDLKFGYVKDQQVCLHQQPLIAPLPMKQVTDNAPFFSFPLIQPGSSSKSYNMYSNWVVFQPDVIIDSGHGCMWKTELYLPSFVDMISDRCLLIEVLLHRNGAKSLILDVVRDMIRPGIGYPLATIGEVFNKLNQVYAYNEDRKGEIEQLSMVDPALAEDAVNVIQQDDVYTHIFCPIFNDDSLKYPTANFPISVLIEYINSLQSFSQQIHFYLYELLVNHLVKCSELFRLHQFLQYHVLTDSKHLACLLLSLQNIYPAAYQIALDMLKRLGTAHDEIVEVFLSKYQVLTAIRYLRSVGLAHTILPRKFLGVAKESGDPDLFFIVYKFFEDINIKKYKVASFAPGDHCSEYEHHFSVLFSV